MRTFQDIKENVQSNVEQVRYLNIRCIISLESVIQVADARSEGRFDGTAPEPRPGVLQING